MTADARPVTIRTLAAMKRRGEPITMLTAYDYPTAKLLDAAGVDVLLVGDSLAMVVGGHDNTLPVTMDQMIYHAEMVARAATRSLVVVDLPFPEGQLSINRSVVAASRVLKETKAHAVKLEGGAEIAPRIDRIVTAGIPVMGHVGLRPQNVHVDGGYRVQRDRDALVADAVAAEEAGAFAVVVECVTAEIGAAITEALAIPTIGIGAGSQTDGQVLVTHDLIGLTSGYTPKFVRTMADVSGVISDTAKSFKQSVVDGSFPGPDESFE